MTDQIEPDATPVEEPTIDAPIADAPVEGEDALGDAGKKALDKMKAEKLKAIADAKAATARAEKAEAVLANKDKPAEEVALETARREATDTANAAANVKLARSALLLAAKGVLADPADALAFIDASAFDVDDNGAVDSDSLNEAIAALLAGKPHLAATKANPFQGGGDGGAKAPAKPATTLDDQIAAAKATGDWKAVISLENQKLPGQAS